jgi:hypothetical protein
VNSSLEASNSSSLDIAEEFCFEAIFLENSVLLGNNEFIISLLELISFCRLDSLESISFNSLSNWDFSLFNEFTSRFGIDFSILIIDASRFAFSSLKVSTNESFSIFLLSIVVITFL